MLLTEPPLFLSGLKQPPSLCIPVYLSSERVLSAAWLISIPFWRTTPLRPLSIAPFFIKAVVVARQGSVRRAKPISSSQSDGRTERPSKRTIGKRVIASVFYDSFVGRSVGRSLFLYVRL